MHSMSNLVPIVHSEPPPISTKASCRISIKGQHPHTKKTEDQTRLSDIPEDSASVYDQPPPASVQEGLYERRRGGPIPTIRVMQAATDSSRPTISGQATDSQESSSRTELTASDDDTVSDIALSLHLPSPEARYGCPKRQAVQRTSLVSPVSIGVLVEHLSPGAPASKTQDTAHDWAGRTMNSGPSALAQPRISTLDDLVPPPKQAHGSILRGSVGSGGGKQPEAPGDVECSPLSSYYPLHG